MNVGDVVAEKTYHLTRDTLVRYAAASGDFNPIHYRDDVAQSVGLPGVLAHGMLTISLAVGRLLDELLVVEDADLVLNYGLDRVRFPAPVPAGSRVRLHARVADVGEQTGGIKLTVSLTVELEGSEKPCCVADEVLLYRDGS